MNKNPYLAHILSTLPRLLALFDNDSTSRSYGMGDRYYWAWGLIDFGNGTFQGAAHGLSRLWNHGMWPYETSKEKFLKRIDAMFTGASVLTRADGSLEEAFPNEGSYCVTALVAFDLLCAIEQLDKDIDSEMKQRWLSIIEPMIGFLIKSDETHAIISNHLATAVAALVRWHSLTEDDLALKKARVLLDCILDHQSDEGWFKEYEGADPGYQSLCTYYLADVHMMRPDWKLSEVLRQSLQFLWHFAHPDGSFAGLYGSRCTRFYYPAGVMALASEIPEARVLAGFMVSSIEDNSVVTLSTMDEPNVIPMFNAYCWAAELYSKQASIIDNDGLTLPSVETMPMRHYFKEAGLLIDRGENHYTIISVPKGGVVYHFDRRKLSILDAGVVVRNRKGELASSQSWSANNTFSVKDVTFVVEAEITRMPKQLPGPAQFTLLRLLCLTVFRFSHIRAWVKKLLVKLLISGSKKSITKNQRTIHLGNALTVKDKMILPKGYTIIKNTNLFVPIHMASQGYWQRQDEQEVGKKG